MNVHFAIAGALALLAALIHGVVGETAVVMKLRTDVLERTQFGGPSMTKLMIRATWHITTLAFLVTGLALTVCAPAGGEACRGVGRVAMFSYAGFAALTLGLAVNQNPRAILRHPAPIVFVGVAVLAWLGSASG